MPTPFYHLSIAQDLLKYPELPTRVRSVLQENQGAFFLGSVAPDVQVVSAQSRAATHFFDLPIKYNYRLPWEEILACHPDLSKSGILPSAQAAFLAGYLCHLQADWRWVLEIFVPVFGLRSRWASFERRLYLHNVLRSYLDRAIVPNLADELSFILRNAQPQHWLPFVADEYLLQWRDLLAVQLQPGGKVSTVDVFAARQGIAADEFHHLLSSETAMQREIFSRLPNNYLDDYRMKLFRENLDLLVIYLAGI